MNLYKKKYLYTNGTSITAGGGFEEYEFRQDVRDAYKQKDITLPDTQRECSYPYFISKGLNLELINESKSGSGINRLIRTTQKWIEENKDKVDETIFLLEVQPGIRLDWYVKEWKDYGILNAHKNSEGKYPFTLVKDWFKDNIEEQVEWNQKFEQSIDGYFDNFFDEDEQYHSQAFAIVCFVSYLNNKNIDYLISYEKNNISTFGDELDKLVPYEKNLDNVFDGSVWSYAQKNKMLISDECENGDNHIGYNGNQFVANKIVKFITKPFKFKIISSDESQFMKEVFKNTDVQIVYTKDVEDADAILLENLNKKTEYKNELSEKFINKQNTSLISNKPILIPLMHEVYNDNTLDKKVEWLSDKFNIDGSNVINLDASLVDFLNRSDVPFELKLKQFGFFDLIDFEEFGYRNKKLTFLNGEISSQRFLILLKVLDIHKKNIKKFKDENLISIRDKEGLFKLISTSNSEFKTKIPFFESINLPWILDDDEKYKDGSADINKFFKIIYDKYTPSIFSIINESENNQDLFNVNIESNYKYYQTSEKTLIPFSAGNMPFVIYDSIYYRVYEDVGFDFSYLKSIFNIDYLNNKISHNYTKLDNFVQFIKSHSIEELNQIRQDHIKVIQNNKERVREIMYGGISEREKKWLNKLKNENGFI